MKVVFFRWDLAGFNCGIMRFFHPKNVQVSPNYFNDIGYCSNYLIVIPTIPQSLLISREFL